MTDLMVLNEIKELRKDINKVFGKLKEILELKSNIGEQNIYENGEVVKIIKSNGEVWVKEAKR